MASGNGSDKKRIDLLEKMWIEDRERWRKNDERWQKTFEYLKRSEARAQRQGERLDTAIQILTRHIEPKK